MTDETQKTEDKGVPQEAATKDTNEGVQQEADDPIKRAESLRKELADAEKRVNDKILELNKLIAHDILAGKSKMFAPPTPPTIQEEAKAEAEKIVKKYYG